MRKFHALLRGCLLTLCAAVVVTLELFLIGETLRRGLPHLSLRLLISAPSAAAGTHGLLPQIINTLLLTAAALAVSLPLSALCAVWLCRTKKKRLRAVLLRAVSALSGVPSAVYGLFGYLVFGGMLSMRYSLLSGAATAALLVLPPTVFLMRSSLDAVPRRLLSGTLSLGAGEGRAVCSVLLRSARDGFVSAALLAASRVAAESAALILTAGIGETMPDGHLVSHFLRSGATLTVGMYQSVLEGENDLAFSSGVVLMLLVLLLDTMAKRRTRP